MKKFEIFAEMAESAGMELEKFKTRFEEDAFYAFEWADNAMQAAARQMVYRAAAAYLERGITEAALKEQALNEALRIAKYPPRSTSVPSNMMAQYKGAAWADIVEKL